MYVLSANKELQIKHNHSITECFSIGDGMVHWHHCMHVRMLVCQNACVPKCLSIEIWLLNVSQLVMVWHIDIIACMSECLSVRMLACQNACLSECLPAIMLVCQNACLSECLPVRMLACQNACLSECLPVRMLACQNACLSKCLYVRMLVYQNAFLWETCLLQWLSVGFYACLSYDTLLE